MRVFVTGASGFIGAAVVAELLGAEHQALGMTRSDAGAASLRAAGAEIHRGTLEEPDSLAQGAAACDGVIHLAFDHDFSRFADNCEKDRRVIAAMAGALRGSDRLMLITSGVGMGGTIPGQPATEDAFQADNANPRVASELAGQQAAESGTRISVVRLPQVHDTKKQGLITPFIAVAREKHLSAYVGEGRNRFAAAHISDVARLYRLAFEAQAAGRRYHAVAEEGVPVRAIAEAIGRGLDVPVASVSEEAAAGHFGWLGHFVTMDLAASSEWTRRTLDWHPTGPDLLHDLAAMDYANP